MTQPNHDQDGLVDRARRQADALCRLLVEDMDGDNVGFDVISSPGVVEAVVSLCVQSGVQTLTPTTLALYESLVRLGALTMRSIMLAERLLEREAGDDHDHGAE